METIRYKFLPAFIERVIDRSKFYTALRSSRKLNLLVEVYILPVDVGVLFPIIYKMKISMHVLGSSKGHAFSTWTNVAQRVTL